MVKNADYSGANAGKLDKITFKIYQDTDAAYNDYARARPGLALPKDSLVPLSGLSLGHTFGMHPGLAPLAPLYAQGRLAWVKARASRPVSDSTP